MALTYLLFTAIVCGYVNVFVMDWLIPATAFTKMTFIGGISFYRGILIFFLNETSLNYFLEHQHSASDSPIKIGVAVKDINRNKHTDYSFCSNWLSFHIIMRAVPSSIQMFVLRLVATRF